MEQTTIPAAKLTETNIQSCINAWGAYAKGGTALPLKFTPSVASWVAELGGHWDYDANDSVVNSFVGLTKVCWRYSALEPGQAAKLYKNLVQVVYDVHGKSSNKTALAGRLTNLTDTLPDAECITKTDMVARKEICQQAASVTIGLYGSASDEGIKADHYWDQFCLKLQGN